MVLCKHSYRPGHDCIYHLNQRLAQTINLVFHQSISDATILRDNVPASALDKVVTFAGEVSCEQIDRRILTWTARDIKY